MPALKFWVSYLLLACAITGLTAAMSLSLYQLAITIAAPETSDVGVRATP
ncbi:MAG: hypothetical protein IGS48_17780 [Oscillatoriales cyanobacterium C42_A2020_001]|nr:hypothetical protein [Leptolyngbyaceae cyanobacterium C42_A2020_001]